MAKKRFQKDLIPPKDSWTAGWREGWKDEIEACKRWRKEARDKIVALSQKEGADIPPLSFSSIQILNPLEIDTDLLEMIESGAKPLTDNLFFELLQASHQYLATEPFQERIALWQAILRDNPDDQVTQKEAKKRLSAIGDILSLKRQGRPREYEDVTIELWMSYSNFLETLEPFINDTKALTRRKRRLLFEKNYPEWSSYSNAFKDYDTAKGIAKQFTVEKHSISLRKLTTILKQWSVR